MNPITNLNWLVKIWNWIKSLCKRKVIVPKISEPKYSHEQEKVRRIKQIKKGQLTFSNGLRKEINNGK